MRLLLLVAMAALQAQQGQDKSKPGWPCVPGRAVDPSYINISESTGGQLFLFQKNEVQHAALVMTASSSHPATVLRAIGTLSGTRDFEFPVDSRTQSLLFMVSLQCRNTIGVFRPAGSELTAANSAQSVELQAGKILRVDNPEPGPWRVRLVGTGLFVVSVLAKTDLSLSGVKFYANDMATSTPLLGIRQILEARLSGTVANLKLQLADASGTPIPSAEATEPTSGGLYRAGITPQSERFRVLATGTDEGAWPFQRMYPNLFQAQRK